MDGSIDVTPQLFIYVRTIVGMVLGLSIARLLTGLARFVQHPGRDRVYRTHIAWVGYLFLTVIGFWWWEIELVRVEHWTFFTYAFLIFYASLFFFLCTLLFPDELREYAGYKDYFLSRRRWFFSLLALTFVADFIDTLLKGEAYFASLGIEYPIRNLLMLALCGVAIASSSPRVHGVLAGAAIAAQVVWIWWQYVTL